MYRKNQQLEDCFSHINMLNLDFTFRSVWLGYWVVIISCDFLDDPWQVRLFAARLKHGFQIWRANVHSGRRTSRIIRIRSWQRSWAPSLRVRSPFHLGDEFGSDELEIFLLRLVLAFGNFLELRGRASAVARRLCRSIDSNAGNAARCSEIYFQNDLRTHTVCECKEDQPLKISAGF